MALRCCDRSVQHEKPCHAMLAILCLWYLAVPCLRALFCTAQKMDVGRRWTRLTFDIVDATSCVRAKRTCT